MALMERWRRAEREQNRRAVLVAVTICRANGQDVTMEDFMPELAEELQEAKALRLLAYLESLAAQPPR